MPYTGPQKYPPANLSYFYQNTYGGTRMESNVVVWHTTEGRTLPTYGGGGSAPNLTAVPDMVRKRLDWYQHFDIDRSSRALVNQSGGVETNTANAVQVELVGTCDPATRDRWSSQGHAGKFIFWPDAPDWALAEVAEFVTWLHDNHNVKIQSTVTWKAYPGSYGNSGVRLTGAQWNAYYGHLGHQHVPENSHGDPGDMDFARVIALALGGTEMALSADDVRAIFETDGIISSPDYDKDPAGNLYWSAESYLRNTYLAARASRERIVAVEAKVDSLATGGVDLEALADKVADKLAERLAE